MKFCTDIHVPQRMKPVDFGKPLTFPLAPQAYQTFYQSCELSQHLLHRLAQNLVQYQLPNVNMLNLKWGTWKTYQISIVTHTSYYSSFISTASSAVLENRFSHTSIHVCEKVKSPFK